MVFLLGKIPMVLATAGILALSKILFDRVEANTGIRKPRPRLGTMSGDVGSAIFSAIEP